MNNADAEDCIICVISLISVGLITYGIYGILYREITVGGRYKETLTYEGRQAVAVGWRFVITGLVALIIGLVALILSLIFIK